MNREKRVRTLPAQYEIPNVCYPRIRKSQKGKKVKKPAITPNLPLQQCTYQSIPFPLKFAYSGGIYHFYGVNIFPNIVLSLALSVILRVLLTFYLGNLTSRKEW